jgi:hypothetical protein
MRFRRVRTALTWVDSKIPVVMLTHPIELALGAALLIAGVFSLFGYLSPSIASLPFAGRVLYLVVSSIGGAGVIAGLVIASRAGKHYDRLAFGLALERAALFLVASAYLGLGAAVLVRNGQAGANTGLVTVVISGALLLRARGIRKASIAVYEALRRDRQAAEQR